MTLSKTTPTGMKALISSSTAKSPSTMKKPADLNSPTKKLTVLPSSIKGKTTPAQMKSPTKRENSLLKTEKSPLKLTIAKANINSTIKTPVTPPGLNKSPTFKTPSAEIRSPIRNIIKPITSSKTLPEQKQLLLKKDTSIVRSSEKPASKTNVNSVSTSKMPTKSSSLVKNIVSSPVKSISPPIKSPPSPVKSLSSPIKSMSSPIKSVSSPTKSMSSPTKSVSSPIKSMSSPIKSVSSPIKSVSSPIKSAPSSIRSVSSPIKSVPSPNKSVSSPIKSVPSPNKSVSSPIKSVSPSVKSISSPIKSISSPVKSVSSPMKSKIICEVNPSNGGKIKDVKTNQLSPISSIKKPINLLKSPIKAIQSVTGKANVSTKLKPNTKNSPTSKVAKNNSISTKTVSKQSPIGASVEVSDLSSSAVEIVDLCHCDDAAKKCEELSNSAPLIIEYPTENTGNFDVVQAFKVAEQLIKIQSSDRNLETIIETCENSSAINWDDVITPCDDFGVCNPNDKNELPSFGQNEFPVPSYNPDESILKRESCIIEMTNSIDTPCSGILNSEPDVLNDELIISTNRDENNNIIEFVNVTDPSSTSKPSSEIVLNNEEYFTIDLQSIITDDNSIQDHCDENEFAEVESNDEEYLTKDESSESIDDSVQNFCNKNELPEWTITIDEFSLELGQKENQLSDVNEIIAEKNYIADRISCDVNISYADILKKTPKVLTNATNIESHRKEPKLDNDVMTKGYPTLKKNKASSTKNMLGNIENSFENCYYNDIYEEPEYCEMRKKKYKKIKHLPKKHLRNVSREYEYIESHTDLFVTQVWKNIY